MSTIVTELLVWAMATYLVAGLLFAVPFVIRGVGRVDANAARGTIGFRLLMLPGTELLWPLMARRWRRGTGEIPVENTVHRRMARARAGGAGVGAQGEEERP